MGSDPISYEYLSALLDAEDVEVRAIVTKPDRRLGQKMQESAFRERLRKERIAIEQFCPENINRPERPEDPDPIEKLASYEADLFVVVAYGQFLGKRVRSLPRHGCLNMHLSLLKVIFSMLQIYKIVMRSLIMLSSKKHKKIRLRK